MKRFAQEYVTSGEDAENILQDVYLSFWERRDIWLSFDNPVAFLYTTIRNRCIDFLRHKALEQETISHLQEEQILSMKMNLDSLNALDEGIFYDEKLEDIISQAIESLPERCRQIFIMNKIEGKKQKEIASELNISVHTVETQMGIAYKKLKESLKHLYPLVFLFL